MAMASGQRMTTPALTKASGDRTKGKVMVSGFVRVVRNYTPAPDTINKSLLQGRQFTDIVYMKVNGRMGELKANVLATVIQR